MGSLAIAGAILYLLFLLMGEWIGFTLTLAGIAGAIVAIGVTADSFIVYFERVRDEMREEGLYEPRLKQDGFELDARSW